MITDSQLQDIYNKAVATKSRNWKAEEYGDYQGKYYDIVGEKENPIDKDDNYIVSSLKEIDDNGYDVEAGILDKNIANYIASVSPEIIIQLIDEVKKLRSQK